MGSGGAGAAEFGTGHTPMARCRPSLLLFTAALAGLCSLGEATIPTIRMVSPPSLYTEVQSTVVLHCAYNATSPVIVTWSHNNSVVASNHFTVRTTEVHTELTLQKLTGQDSGLYACSVAGHSGRSTAVTRLQVVPQEEEVAAVLVADQNTLLIPEPDLDLLNRHLYAGGPAKRGRHRSSIDTEEAPGGQLAAAKTKKKAVQESAWFIVTLCLALVISSVLFIMLCAARRRARARKLAKAAESANAPGESGEQKAEAQAAAHNGDASLPAGQDLEAKAKKYGFDYGKPQAVQTLSHSPTASRPSSFRSAKSESTIPQMLVTQKKDSLTSSSPPDGFKNDKQSDTFMLTTSLSDVAALSKDAARRSRHHIKHAPADADSNQAHRSGSASALASLPDTSETNLTDTPPLKQSTRLRMTISEMTKGAFKSFRKPQKAAVKDSIGESPSRPRAKTTSSGGAAGRQLSLDSSKSSARQPQGLAAAAAANDADDEELTHIKEEQGGGRPLNAVKLSKSLECLDSRDRDLPPLTRPGGALTPPPTGCAPLALLRPKPRPRASTNVSKAVRKPRVTVEYRAVSPTSWDYTNGAPPSLPIIQNAAAGISTPPSTLSKRKEVQESASCPGGPPPALPTGRPPSADKRPLPLPIPRKSRKVTGGNGEEKAAGGDAKEKEGQRERCDTYEKVDVAALLRASGSAGQTKVHKTHSAPRPDHIYDKPEGRDPPLPAAQRPRPDVALSYAISGPLDDKMQSASRSQQLRRSDGDIQIAELDDILQSIEGSKSAKSTPDGSPPPDMLPDAPHFYDRPGHIEKFKSRDRSQSLNQRPTHDPLVQYTSLEFFRKERAEEDKEVKSSGPTVYAIVDPKATKDDLATKAPLRPKSPVDDYEPVETPRLIPHSFKLQRPRDQFQAQQQKQRTKKQVFQKSLKW